MSAELPQQPDLLRGHPVYLDGDVWRFVDDDSPTVANWHLRPCGNCGEHTTPEGHDHCLGTLPGAINACCGHGDESQAYVQLMDGEVLTGSVLRRWLDALPGHAEVQDGT